MPIYYFAIAIKINHVGVIDSFLDDSIHEFTKLYLVTLHSKNNKNKKSEFQNVFSFVFTGLVLLLITIKSELWPGQVPTPLGHH